MSRPEDPPNDRLNGWKEIAAFLGKGVRTVQRWEREYGLPVHRIGREGGEIVFASRGEFDGWLREHELRTRREDQARRSGPETSVVEPLGAVRAPMPVVPESVHVAAATPADSERGWRTRARTWLLRTAAVAIIALTGAFIWPRAFPQPAFWKADRDTLYIYNRLGRELWHKPLFDGLEEQLKNDGLVDKPGGKIALKDVDGDGSIEVMIAAVPPDKNTSEAAFYIFSSDGTPRKVVRPDQRRLYGDPGSVQLQAGPPWAPAHIFVLRHSIFVVFIHGQDYPTLLLELDAHGNKVSEYSSDGYIETVSLRRWRGRDALFVGGANNETKGGVLAIFEDGHAGGFAPSTNPEYRCQDCVPGASSELVLFPQRCIARRVGGSATVDDVWVEDELRLHIRVAEGPKGPDNMWRATVLYTLGPDLVVSQVEHTDGLLDEHDELYRQGKLNHRYGPQDDVDSFLVRHWVAPTWVNLPFAAGLKPMLAMAGAQGQKP